MVKCCAFPDCTVCDFLISWRAEASWVTPEATLVPKAKPRPRAEACLRNDRRSPDFSD